MSYRLKLGALAAALILVSWLWTEARADAVIPAPAAHVCLELTEGDFEPLAPPTRVFGAGLTYAEHLRETGQAPRPGAPPPIFEKTYWPTSPTVEMPDAAAHRRAVERMEPGLSRALSSRDIHMTPLLDYEVELGVVLLEDERPGDPPALGFFVANDLSERALAVLGEGRPNRFAYWGESKSFAGFLPTGERLWRPRAPVRDGIPCVRLTTRVNGGLRQDQRTSDMVYTMTELLDAVRSEAGEPLRAGTWILTGTPSGVALATPAWKLRLANAVGLDRFTRLAAVYRATDRFLSPGDEVAVDAEGLGGVTVRIAGP